MMHTFLNLRLGTLGKLGLAAFVLSAGGSMVGVASSAIAAPLFSQQEIDQNKLVAVASPYGGNAHQLLIIEQVSNVRQCWSESGSNPTTINPLLTQFDFTNICSRSVDSNGYSVRTGGQDLNWSYSLRAVRRGNDIVLLGIPNIDRSAPELLIGRTRGYTNGFAKFYLEPGWRLTKRAYEGTTTGHIYLTNNQTLASLNVAAIASRSVPTPPVANRPLPTVAVTPNPTYGTPTYGTPTYGTPTYGTPTYGTPTYGTPIYVPPVYTPPTSTPPVTLNQPQSVTPVQPTLRQKRRQSWRERMSGSRRSANPNFTNNQMTGTPSRPEVARPDTVLFPGEQVPVTNAAGDVIVPTISVTQP